MSKDAMERIRPELDVTAVILRSETDPQSVALHVASLMHHLQAAVTGNPNSTGHLARVRQFLDLNRCEGPLLGGDESEHRVGSSRSSTAPDLRPPSPPKLVPRSDGRLGRCSPAWRRVSVHERR